ncbi:zinc ribbon domain-containing protein [Paucibacter sp. AS339]|uniref:zinc ribbon domain-containing protein n=1 Tax=Paucibacter hankyongi TaxID=3133434 RepID=UPI0030AD1242
MSPANAPRPCPYCDHVSPPDSKFCNECGAALHLQPCPHCGAVNDITKSTVCGRCQGDLHPPQDTQPAEDLPVLSVEVEPPPSPASSSSATPPTAPAAAPFSASLYSPPQQRRSPVLLLGLLTLALGAGGYYAYQSYLAPTADPRHATEGSPDALQPQVQAPTQTGTASLTPSPSGTEQAPSAPAIAPMTTTPSAGQTPAVDSPPVAKADASSAAAVEAANTAEATASAGALNKPAAPARLAAKQLPRPEASSPTGANASATPAPLVSSRQRSEAQQGLDLKKPQINSCTDAVAALGLCTPDTKPRSP